MKSLNTSNCGKILFREFSEICSLNRRNFRHLLSTGKKSFIWEPSCQHRVTSVIFSADSNSAKSLRVRQFTQTQSVSTWRQLLKIYEKMSSVIVILKAIKVTSFRSIASRAEINSSSSFLKRAMSLCNSIPFRSTNMLNRLKEWMFKQAERIHLTSAEIGKSIALENEINFHHFSYQLGYFENLQFLNS